jgi:hypothetical protein
MILAVINTDMAGETGGKISKKGMQVNRSTGKNDPSLFWARISSNKFLRSRGTFMAWYSNAWKLVNTLPIARFASPIDVSKSREQALLVKNVSSSNLSAKKGEL